MSGSPCCGIRLQAQIFLFDLDLGFQRHDLSRSRFCFANERSLSVVICGIDSPTVLVAAYHDYC